jgi:hypothetical protein
VRVRKPELLQLALHAPAVQLPMQLIGHGLVLLQDRNCTVPLDAGQALPPLAAAVVTTKVALRNPELLHVALHDPSVQLPVQLTGGGHTPAMSTTIQNFSLATATGGVESKKCQRLPVQHIRKQEVGAHMQMHCLCGWYRRHCIAVLPCNQTSV